ncbi:MAG TPA: hypothetical protein VI356_06300 [Myxococcales bacterium]
MNACMKRMVQLAFLGLLAAAPGAARAEDDGDRELREPYIVAWAGDQDDKDSDFLAVIDADRNSKTYGKVLRTYRLPEGIDKHNEPHHMTHAVTPDCKLFAGGLMSGITYVFDLKDPLNIPPPKTLTPGADYPFLLPDDFIVLPNRHVVGTYVGSLNLTSPGGVVEFDGQGNVLDLFPVGDDVTANPHGITVKDDINRIVTSGFGVPITLFSAQRFNKIQTHTNVRIFDRTTHQLLHVVELPTGARFAASGGDLDQRENFAVMETSFFNGPGKTGFFASAMGGGGLFYCPDATSSDPQCHLVFDYGFNSGPGRMLITRDDHYMIQPMTTIGLGGGTPKRMVVLDITDPMHPVQVDELRVDDPTTGGPHFAAFDRAERRIAWSDYFVDDFQIPVKVDGDHRLHLATFRDGKLKEDEKFRDEIDGQPGVNFNRLSWPHGASGNAKPHGLIFAPARCTPAALGH